MIESVSLNLWNENGDCIECDLEPFQVKALVQILGLKITPRNDGGFDIASNGPKTISNILKKLGVEE